MQIAFIIPPSPQRRNIIRMIDCSHEAKANYLWQPNDLMIISSILDPSDGAVFIDGTADGLTERRFLRELDQVNGDLLITALSSVCWESDYYYFQKIRRRFPHIPLYVLGDIFLDERYRRVILQECAGIIVNPYQLDLSRMAAAVAHETLPGVCTRAGRPLFPEGKRALFVSSRPPRHELFLKKGYRFPFAHHLRFATVTTMWGCPFLCTYCSDSNFPPVVRLYKDVLEELQQVRGLGIEELFFADKVFGFSRENIYPLLEEMAAQFHFSWSCYFHPQLYDPMLIDLMRSAGCHTMIIGVDSADIASLQQYKRRVDKKKIEQLVEHASRIGISVCADFILGLSHETAEDIERTIQYALALSIDFASFNVAAPLPGSDIREQGMSAGMLRFGNEGFDTCGRMGVLGNRNVSADQLRRLRRKALWSFYLRPAYLWRRLRRTRSPEHLWIQVQEMITMIRKI